MKQGYMKYACGGIKKGRKDVILPARETFICVSSLNAEEPMPERTRCCTVPKFLSSSAR